MRSAPAAGSRTGPVLEVIVPEQCADAAQERERRPPTRPGDASAISQLWTFHWRKDDKPGRSGIMTGAGKGKPRGLELMWQPMKRLWQAVSTLGIVTSAALIATSGYFRL